MPTVSIAIGNSDDKLTQAEWHDFSLRVGSAVHRYASTTHAVCFALSNAKYQNAVFLFEIEPSDVQPLKELLASEAGVYRQESIAWLEGSTEFVRAWNRY